MRWITLIVLIWLNYVIDLFVKLLMCYLRAPFCTFILHLYLRQSKFILIEIEFILIEMYRVCTRKKKIIMFLLYSHIIQMYARKNDFI